MSPCYCSSRPPPAPICCCSWPPKPHQCYCPTNQFSTTVTTCQNFTPKCPCTTYICHPRQPPLRTMQKALVDKWTEIEKLGQLAHVYWCQHKALQHQLACLQAKYCRLQNQCFPDTQYPDQYSQMRCKPENPSVYQGVLRIRERDSTPNQLCVCNNPETTTTYRGVVRMHDQEEAGDRPCRPAQYGTEYGLETEKLRTECEMRELNNRLTKVNKCEEEIHEKLQNLREELANLQTKIMSNWGQNALDKCTPAKENQTRFF